MKIHPQVNRYYLLSCPYYHFYFINAILRIDGNRQRIQMVEDLHIPEERLAIFVHPTAYVAPNVLLSPGCVIMPLVTMSSNTKLFKFIKLIKHPIHV